MVNVKKSVTVLKHFVLILTLSLAGYDSSAQTVVTIIEGKQINVNENLQTKQEYETFVSPYRDKINKDLDAVLAICPETLDKSKGQWQSNIGDMLAMVVLEKGNTVFNKRENKNIDMCILNHGGIRAIMPQGNVSARTAFEIQPFENSAIVIGLKGEQIAEFTEYFVREKKPHPTAGISFTITVDNKVKDIKVNNEPLVLDKVYYVATSDYLANGGDKMDFFKKGVSSTILDYKLRNMLIDYMKDVDTIKVSNEVRITQEK